jgi:uncharacterized protein
MNYSAAKQFILNKLRFGLSEHLHYHGLHHTLDVLDVAGDLCVSEKINKHQTLLVKTAALFHDSGFVTNVHTNHELASCEIAREALPDFGYLETEIDIICGMILATKIPQSPSNILEEIICDADLDYLGRKDFEKIGNTLFEELKAYNILHDLTTWNKLQVSFLSNHTYFTRTNKGQREKMKRKHLFSIETLVATYEK